MCEKKGSKSSTDKGRTGRGRFKFKCLFQNGVEDLPSKHHRIAIAQLAGVNPPDNGKLEQSLIRMKHWFTMCLE